MFHIHGGRGASTSSPLRRGRPAGPFPGTGSRARRAAHSQTRLVPTRPRGEERPGCQLPWEWLPLPCSPQSPQAVPTPLQAQLQGFLKDPEAPALPGNGAPASQVSQAVRTCVFGLVGSQCILLPRYSSLPQPRGENRADCFPSLFPRYTRSTH